MCWRCHQSPQPLSKSTRVGVEAGVAYCIDNFSRTAGCANFIFVIYTTAQTHKPKLFVPDDPWALPAGHGSSTRNLAWTLTISFLFARDYPDSGIRTSLTIGGAVVLGPGRSDQAVRSGRESDTSGYFSPSALAESSIALTIAIRTRHRDLDWQSFPSSSCSFAVLTLPSRETH